MPRLALALALTLASSGCGKSSATRDPGHADAAREELSKAFSCPAASVTVTPRPDLSAYDLQVAPRKPPSDVAADPARLAEWTRREDEGKKGYASMTVQQASGCGHEVYYTCSLASSTYDQQVVACSKAQRPPK